MEVLVPWHGKHQVTIAKVYKPPIRPIFTGRPRLACWWPKEHSAPRQLQTFPGQENAANHCKSFSVPKIPWSRRGSSIGHERFHNPYKITARMEIHWKRFTGFWKKTRLVNGEGVLVEHKYLNVHELFHAVFFWDSASSKNIYSDYLPGWDLEKTTKIRLTILHSHVLARWKSQATAPRLRLAFSLALQSFGRTWCAISCEIHRKRESFRNFCLRDWSGRDWDREFLILPG